MSKDLLGREIFTHNYVCQIGSDTTKGASTANAGKIGKVVNFTARGRVKVEFLTENGVKVSSVVAGFLVLVRFVDGAWTPKFSTRSKVDAEAQHAADRSGTYEEEIRVILDKIAHADKPTEESKTVTESEPVVEVASHQGSLPTNNLSLRQAVEALNQFMKIHRSAGTSDVITYRYGPDGPVELRASHLRLMLQSLLKQ